uniref:(northern house mosquito) hypothetical protein n=1 Tax=Culex pipiens TaxID=7175 RepID=A0A8D8J544_CULPI
MRPQQSYSPSSFLSPSSVADASSSAFVSPFSAGTSSFFSSSLGSLGSFVFLGLAGAFFGLGSAFGGAGLFTNLSDLLLGSETSASLFALLLLGMAVGLLNAQKNAKRTVLTLKKQSTLC